MWKPGQLVTINKKVYRIRKRDFNTQSGCYECAFSDNSWSEEPCAATCPHKMYYEYYFELIITKRNLNIPKPIKLCTKQVK